MRNRLHNTIIFATLGLLMIISYAFMPVFLGVWGGMPTSFVLPASLMMVFSHHTSAHLLSNLMVGSLASIMLIVSMSRYQIYAVLFFGSLSGGIGAWFGTGSLHIGSSGLVWAMITSGLLYGLSKVEEKWVKLAYVPTLFSVGMLVNTLIPMDGVSFESHVGGALGGLVIGHMMLAVEGFQEIYLARPE
mgnify:CR=1 FL=1|tara:strand:+ start:12011 stop:12577 length:567 start_codon:yes stop_codon:yes gene_type:complete